MAFSTFVHAVAWVRIAPTMISKGESPGHQSLGSVGPEQPMVNVHEGFGSTGRGVHSSLAGILRWIPMLLRVTRQL